MPGRRRGGSETILLADDEPASATWAGDACGSRGYRVLMAEDGAEAVELFRARARPIDLVVLDLTMPRLSGRGALRADLVQIRPGRRVLFASGYLAEASPEPAAEGVLGFLQKPFHEQELARLVTTTLDRTRSTEPRA